MLLDPGASASRARQLRWPAGASLRAFESRLRGSLQTWSEAWGTGPVEVHCEPAWLARDAGELHWQALAQSPGGEPLAWAGTTASRAAERLSVLLFGKPAPTAVNTGAATLADGVAEDAWQAWRDAVAAALHGTALPALDPFSNPPAADRRTWSGAVQATLSLGDETWVLHVSATAVDAPSSLAASAGAPRDALQPLTQALWRHGFAVRACLDDVSVTLGELLALQAGDVLLTAHRLSKPLHVVDPGASAPTLYAAHLAQRDGHMAVLLAPNERLEGNRMNPTILPTAQLLGLPEANDPAASAPSVAAAMNPLFGVKTTLQVCVGEAVLTVGELTQARVGQVIKLDREVDGLVDLMLDGRVVARGQLVAVDDCFGVRLTELPLPLNSIGPTGA